MIIFDLDGTLADCEHRRHFVDPKKQTGYMIAGYDSKGSLLPKGSYTIDDKKWKPNWKAFYEACDQDKPIAPAIMTLRRHSQHEEVQIWSGRCESVREKTIEWFDSNIPAFAPKSWFYTNLKMRPIGDSTPDDQLKEMWLNGECADLMQAHMEGRYAVKHNINFVFDDRPKVVRMWRRRGIFVFNCCQHDNEF